MSNPFDQDFLLPLINRLWEIMNMRTITIELRVDFDTKEKEEIIMTACKRAANHIWTQALMIKDKRDPQIALMSGDMFTATEDIALSEGLDDPVAQEEPEQKSLDV